MAIEHPDFNVVAESESKSYEIREYDNHIVAETLVQGDFNKVGILRSNDSAGIYLAITKLIKKSQ